MGEWRIIEMLSSVEAPALHAGASKKSIGGAARGNAENHDTTNLAGPSTVGKALLVSMLSLVLEVAPRLAHRLCGIVLALWPGMREG
jgi:hypothetical protein